MWILPKNYPLSSHFAQDMVASKEDLTLPGLNIESSLMWRSKLSPLPTWLRRWKPGSYLPHLFTRILKPSQQKSFEEKLASSLVDIHVSHFQRLGIDLEKTTQDISGRTSGDTLNQLDLIEYSLKTSKVTFRLDCPQSFPTWKKMVIDQRGEYSARLKSARRIRESESSSWLTPMVQDSKHSGTNPGPNGNRKLLANQVNWIDNFPIPGTTECRSDTLNLVNRVKKGKQIMLTHYVRLYPTPSTRDWKDTPGMALSATNKDGTERKRNDQLARAVYATENPVSGHLNPDWVEWLMGLPTGWTGLGSWETE